MLSHRTKRRRIERCHSKEVGETTHEHEKGFCENAKARVHDQPPPRLTANRFVSTKHNNQKQAGNHSDGTEEEHCDDIQGNFIFPPTVHRDPVVFKIEVIIECVFCVVIELKR